MMTDSQSNVLALDFGGTKLAAAVVNLNTGIIRSFKCANTPINSGASVSIIKMFEIGRQALDDCRIDIPLRVGISFGGPVTLDRRHVLMSNHIPEWEGNPLPRSVEDEFHCPAFMDNDANLAAYGSWIFDVDRVPDQMIYIQVSTGIGAGLILDRKLYRGSSLAGEIGHITVAPDGPLCPCGKHGCLESFSAGWALAKAGRTALEASGSESPLFKLSNGDTALIDAKMLLAAAEQGDKFANIEVNKAFTALGRAISTMEILFDPQVIVLGGGVTRAEQLLRSIIEPVIHEDLHPLFRDRIKIIFSKLGGKETILGAAFLDN
jgi:glucokinase